MTVVGTAEKAHQSKRQPEPERNHALSDVDDDGVKFVQPIRIIRVIDSIEQPQLHGKRNPISELDVLLDIFLVLEPFEVQCQDVWEFLDLHPLFSFLKITATITEELVLLT